MTAPGETQRMNAMLKWALAIVGIFAASGGVGGGVYTAKLASNTREEIASAVASAVDSAVKSAMTDGLDRIRKEQEEKIKEMRGTIGDLQTRLSREESTIASIQSEMLPRLARLEEETSRMGKDVAYIRGLLERKQ